MWLNVSNYGFCYSLHMHLTYVLKVALLLTSLPLVTKAYSVVPLVLEQLTSTDYNAWDLNFTGDSQMGFVRKLIRLELTS